MAVPTITAAPPAPPQYFVVCASAPNLPTVYFSGIVEAAPNGFQEVRTRFADYLTQHFSYKGAVACAPTNSLANAQKAVQARATALRNAKKNVVETGWTEGGGLIAAQIAGALAPATTSAVSQGFATSAQPAGAGSAATTGGRATSPSARSAAAGRGGASATGNGGAGSAGTSDLAATLSSIFGTPGGECGAGSSGASGGGGSGNGGKGKAGGGAPAAASGGEAGCQSPFAQVSGTLTNVFGGSAGTAQSASGGGESRGGASPPQQEGLGSAEAQSTKLVVYGCGRHDTQVACVTDLTNENAQDTLVLSEVWKDAFIVDDRGDRHPRSKGFFLNIDGDQRSQLDIGYGKSARFVLMFDGVQSKVQKVALRSPSGGLDVEDISLLVSGGDAAAARTN